LLIVTIVSVPFASLPLFIKEDDGIMLRSCEAFATRSIDNNGDVEKLGKGNDDAYPTSPETY